jgi:ribonuclease Y
MLQQVASMTEEQARRTLKAEVEADLVHDASSMIRRIQEDARANAEKQARDIIATAIERYAADQVSEVTTCTVSLPNEEMKGRIIGREGRNIRSLEAATGINILIDDTPEVAVISGFDPLRREVARVALENLINDGRIHPARIEEVVRKVQTEIDETIRESGEDALYELKLRGLAPDITRTLGRLKYRHSYGQNVLAHSIEMAHVMGMMASELGLDPAIARRIGLLHDIGKALDHTIEGSHAIIGADLIRKHGESATVVNAVAAHHNDVEPESVYAVLTKAADAITAARPGARSETTALYLQRLEKLEAIANSFRGVNKSYAIQAGREIRVLVEPTQISDGDAVQLARNVCKRVENELEYPGQIKVTVVRETRCVEYAR